MEKLIGGKYKIVKKLGSGSFGELYKGINVTNSEEVALKFEKKNIKCPQLQYEFKLYKYLEGGVGIPKVYQYLEEEKYNIMVMELLGPSLENLFSFCKRKLSLKTVLMIADQMINRIEYFHSKNYIYRDIKPDNFLIGTGKNANQIYIIDFGLCKRYRDQKNGMHIQYKENKSLTGTARYASINTHMGREQSRRDDLEAIGYVLIYFLTGTLPWQGLKVSKKKDKYEKIKEKKQQTSIDQLCEGFPDEFAMYLKYCRSLQFEDRPDYYFLKKQFKDLFYKVDKNSEWDFNYDWVTLEYQKKMSQEQQDEQLLEEQRKKKKKLLQIQQQSQENSVPEENKQENGKNNNNQIQQEDIIDFKITTQKKKNENNFITQQEPQQLEKQFQKLLGGGQSGNGTISPQNRILQSQEKSQNSPSNLKLQQQQQQQSQQLLTKKKY